MERYVGTDELIGATIVACDGYNYEVLAEKDGRKFILRKETEWSTCMCGDYCSGDHEYSYIRAYEEVADPPKKARKSKAK